MERSKSSDNSPLLSGDSMKQQHGKEPGNASSNIPRSTRLPTSEEEKSEKKTASSKAKRRNSSEYDERFECNICLSGVEEPVVTRCGHLFCWPCLYRWLHSNHPDCPVCKAGVTPENVIPLYGRGMEEVDPRSKPQQRDSNIPSRPTAERPDVQQPRFQGIPGGFGINQGNFQFTTGVGFFPSLFGLQFQSFIPTPPNQNNANLTPEERQQAFLSKLLLTLGSIIIVCLLLF